ncbi:MAG: CD225/dispanin family protein [Candidatus Nanopelagicales bacterium]
MGMAPKPNNNLVWAILTTLFCCLPFGIAAIVYASKVDSLYAAGQYAQAQQAADSAKKWSIWAAVVGGVLIVAYLVFVVILGVLAGSNGY